MIKAVLFDLDGTLLNREASLHKFVENQYERFINFLYHIQKENYCSRFIELDSHGYVWKDKVYQQLVDDFSIKELSWEILLQDYETNFHTCSIPFSGLTMMLDYFKHHSLKIGLITNGKEQFQMNNIKALGIEKYFDSILISGREGLKKPDTEIFKKALDQLNIEASKSVYIGDHPINDVKAAKNAGLIGIWKRDSFWECKEAEFIIDHLHELPALIEKLKV